MAINFENDHGSCRNSCRDHAGQGSCTTGNSQHYNSNISPPTNMDSEINSQSDAQLKDDATDQQPDAQPIDSETNPQSSAQLEAMGFASFGQKHKRPKHHHGNSSLELAPASLPKKPPASISPPTETGQTNKNQVSYSIAEKLS